MSYLVVFPYAYQPYFEACKATMKFPDNNVMYIDNTNKNIGIMAAHNLGAKKVLEEGIDWLVILSAAIRFGESGGLDFVELLEEKKQDHYIIHAATPNVMGGKQQTGVSGGPNGVYGWHCSAFRRDVFENIGLWDENFSPYGFDDIDLSIRIQKHYKGQKGWDTYPIDVSDTTMAHSLKLAHVKSPPQPKIDYFIRKWGRDHAQWQNPGYDHPFNDPTKDLKYWPKSGEHNANEEAWTFLRNNEYYG